MNSAKQRLLLEYLLSNTESFSLCKQIIEPSFFNLEYRSLVEFMLLYSDTYKSAPSLEIVNAEFGIEFEDRPDAGPKGQWILDETEKFCRLQKTIQAIENATEAIANGDLDSIVEPIKQAVLTGLTNNHGLDYFKDPKARLTEMMQNCSQPTGFRDLDYALFGGIEEGGVNIIAANSGKGKSMFLANIAINWAEMGKNVLYISLELGEKLIAKRLDAMISHVAGREIFQKINEVDGLIRSAGSGMGHIQIKFFPPQTKVNVIEAFILDYMIKTGKKPDILILDYLDLLMPNHSGVNINDQFLKDKFVTEDIRALHHEFKLYGFTASQLNRTGVDVTEHTQANIAGGISKINTADLVATIYRDQQMKEEGVLEIQLIKTRNSTGDGQKILLETEEGTMRMRDLPTEHPRAKKVPSGSRNNSGSNHSDPRIARIRERIKANQT